MQAAFGGPGTVGGGVVPGHQGSQESRVCPAKQRTDRCLAHCLLYRLPGLRFGSRSSAVLSWECLWACNSQRGEEAGARQTPAPRWGLPALPGHGRGLLSEARQTQCALLSGTHTGKQNGAGVLTPPSPRCAH